MAPDEAQFDDATLGDAPPSDALAEQIGDMQAADAATEQLPRSVAKARIANALFSTNRGVAIGRYRLLARAGHGGMGVVWSAWDPELERRVAIKLVRPTVRSAREQMLREGQALAKLSHPNVVPVFDVGIVDDQIYLVMEWVRGSTLRALHRGRLSVREIVAIYRQACAGLAAAHRAGVIHRDFKPENAICGEDGRVRVLDFGLAAHRADAGDARGVVGTPRYMAPEQAQGLTVTAAVDQYALCASLREALGGRWPRSSAVPLDDADAPHDRDARSARRTSQSKGRRAPKPAVSVPRWLDVILTRGTAIDPAARFPTMDALGAALERDPLRRWRRRVVVAVVVSGIALAFAIGQARSTDTLAQRCNGAATRISTTWNPATRVTVTNHLRGLGPFGAHEAARLADEFASYGDAWAGAHTQACVAYNRGELPPVLYEQRLRCLGRSEAAFAAAIEIATEVTAEKLSDALIAARSLPSATGCANEDLVAVAPPPQAMAADVAEIAGDVERSRMLALAASPRALAAADAAANAAQATGYAPLVARATMIQGWVHASTDPSSASDLLEQAFHIAVRVGDDVLAVEAYARAWFVASRVADFRPSQNERALVEDLAERTGAPGRFSRALLYNNLATERIVADDRATARSYLRRALDTWRPPLDDRAHDIELVAVLRNLALVEDNAGRRVELSQRAGDSLQLQLGPEHPATINARIQLALLTSNPIAASHVFSQTCAAIPAWHSGLQSDCAYEEGWFALDRGDAARAIAAMTVAQRSSSNAARGQIAAAYLDIVEGNRARVTAACDAMRNLARERSAQAGWWTHAEAADAWMIVALGHAALGRSDPSTRAWQLALAQLADQPVLERRRTRVQSTLARRLLQAQPAEALSLAAAALQWYRSAGGYDADVAALETLLATK